MKALRVRLRFLQSASPLYASLAYADSVTLLSLSKWARLRRDVGDFFFSVSCCASGGEGLKRSDDVSSTSVVLNGVKKCCAASLLRRRHRRDEYYYVQTLTFDPPRVGLDVWLVKVEN